MDPYDDGMDAKMSASFRCGALIILGANGFIGSLLRLAI